MVGDCPSLKELARLPSCEDGDVFVALSHGAQGGAPDDWVKETARPGALVALRDPQEHQRTPVPTWRIPESARTVDARLDPVGRYQFGIFATPSAIDVARLDGPEATALVRVDETVPDAAEHVRNTAAPIDLPARVRTLQDTERDAQYGRRSRSASAWHSPSRAGSASAWCS
ncbi:hypothetical protein [Streptomyces sp. P9(2023)]|uniref:hypothetical protein n=1 Tax=Streptomyces sp. P9(2023) TaxID=3064394 RepID=UPI0028F452D7|nr:hypothetical protein [Streptomyces sp. P9(2023)]